MPICSACSERLPFVGSGGCAICGRDMGASPPGSVCDDCSGPHAPHFDCAASALRFEGEARRMILDYKFNRHFWVADFLADCMVTAARSRFPLVDVDLILPMPVTVFHRIDRGYNQCEILAKHISALISRRCRTDILRRKGHPRRQADLSGAERRTNVLGTFAVSRPSFVEGRTILVIDDVMTTGSTLSECAHALKDAGAWRVFALTAAKAIR